MKKERKPTGAQQSQFQNQVQSLKTHRLQTSCLISLNRLHSFNNVDQSHWSVLRIKWGISKTSWHNCLTLSICALTIIPSLKIRCLVSPKILAEITQSWLHLAFCRLCQPQSLFVKPAVCISVHRYTVCRCLCMEGKNKCQAALCTVPHLSTSMWSGLRLCFRGFLSYYSDHTASDCFTSAHKAVVLSILFSST